MVPFNSTILCHFSCSSINYTFVSQKLLFYSFLFHRCSHTCFSGLNKWKVTWEPRLLPEANALNFAVLDCITDANWSHNYRTMMSSFAPWPTIVVLHLMPCSSSSDVLPQLCQGWRVFKRRAKKGVSFVNNSCFSHKPFLLRISLFWKVRKLNKAVFPTWGSPWPELRSNVSLTVARILTYIPNQLPFLPWEKVEKDSRLACKSVLKWYSLPFSAAGLGRVENISTLCS